jgi:hypothetical protein
MPVTSRTKHTDGTVSVQGTRPSRLPLDYGNADVSYTEYRTPVTNKHGSKTVHVQRTEKGPVGQVFGWLVLIAIGGWLVTEAVHYWDYLVVIVGSALVITLIGRRSNRKAKRRAEAVRAPGDWTPPPPAPVQLARSTWPTSGPTGGAW